MSNYPPGAFSSFQANPNPSYAANNYASKMAKPSKIQNNKKIVSTRPNEANPQQHQAAPQAGVMVPSVPLAPLNMTLSKRRKLTERKMPAKLEKMIPESALFSRLVEFEKRLDALIMRKRYDIQDALRKPIKTKRTLRVFLSNLAHNQSWGKAASTSIASNASGAVVGTDMPDDFLNENDEEIPSWTFKIDGRLLENTKSKAVNRKFSSFIRSMLVEFDRNAIQQPESNIVEWIHPLDPNAAEFDGFEIKRKGETNVTARVVIHLLNNPEKYKVSPELSQLLEIHTESKADIISALWKYIKVNQLQDAESRTTINNDQALQKIFGCKQMALISIPELITGQLSPPDPIILSYTMNVEQTFSTSQVAFDIDVDVDESKQNMETFLLSATSQKDLAELEQSIMSTIRQISNCKRKREFLLEFIQNPVLFINRWIDSQAADLKELLGEKAIEAEELRRSDFFQQPWIDEAVTHYIHSINQEKVNSVYGKMRPK
jgi:SWI/SNF-related matrix-associated actin-dependent regulator of chromatin subfamily D